MGDNKKNDPRSVFFFREPPWFRCKYILLLPLNLILLAGRHGHEYTSRIEYRRIYVQEGFHIPESGKI